MSGSTHGEPEFFATLGMYEFPSTARANDELWQAIGRRLREAELDAPQRLTRDNDPSQLWASPRLLFGQTCSYPFISGLHRQATLVATPIYDFPGCFGTAHCSFLIVRASDPRADVAALRGRRAIVNSPDSNSGMNLFRAMIAPHAGAKSFFRDVALSGSHLASLAAVAGDEADVASIDCVTFGLIQREKPELTQAVRVIATSPRSPGLPIIVSKALAPTHLDALRVALVTAIADPSLSQARRALGLVGAQILAPEHYAIIAEIERAAIDLGYPTLA